MLNVETGIIRAIAKELMTIDNSQIFDLKDIANIQFVCLKCQGRYVARLSDWRKIPVKCSNCNEDLVKNQSLEHEALQKLQDALKKLLESNNPDLKIRFELTTPKS
jgi:transcription initiation factor IIE alpha subunit